MLQRSVKFWVAAGALALAVSVLCGACVASKAAPPVKREDRGIKFPHKTHTDQGIGCTDCHTLEDAKAAMPTHDNCGACHEINMEQPDEKACAFCHTREGYEILPLKPILDEEKKFSHQAHETGKVECATCHKDPDGAVLPTKALKPFCMDCHQKNNPALNECEVCHTKINRETVPLLRAGTRIQHDAPQVWQNVHGQESRVNPAYCALCHDERTSCEECHQKNPPDSHTISWKRRTHGLQASWNRQSCAACHEEDSCLKCHKHTAPESHRGQWAGAANTHCVQCHFPADKTNCTVCHENIDHEKALPSPHIVGIYPANCALCHPGGVPYRAPHLLNSTIRCAGCHR